MVIDATFAVTKRKPEKIQACTGFAPLTSAIPVQCCTGIGEVKGSNPRTSLNFFKLSFHNCKSCYHNYNGLLYI